MIAEMQKVLATKPPWVRITRWKLGYSQADELARELYAMQLYPFQALGDLLGSLCDGNATMFNVQIEVVRR